MENILFVKVPKKTNWNLNLLCINKVYDAKISMINDNNLKFNQYDFGVALTSIHDNDSYFADLELFADKPYFSSSNYDVYVFKIQNRYTYIQLLYQQEKRPLGIRFYLTESLENATGNYFVIEMPENNSKGNYKIKCLDKNNESNNEFIQKYKDIAEKEKKVQELQYQLNNYAIKCKKEDLKRASSNLQKQISSKNSNDKKVQAKQTKLSKVKNKKILFFVLGIISLGLLATFCALSFGFALIAAKIAISLIVLSAIFSAVSFGLFVKFHKKSKNISNNIEKLNNQIEEANNRIEKAKDQIVKANNQIEEYIQNNENLTPQINELKQEIEPLSQQLNNLSEQNEVFNNAISDIKLEQEFEFLR